MKTKKAGFTLAELLIVVAIIGILVAVSIPIFVNQHERSCEATDLANIRAAYADACQQAMMDENGSGEAITVSMTQTIPGWQHFSPSIGGNYIITEDGTSSGTPINPTKGDILKVMVDEAIYITFSHGEGIDFS